MNERTVAVAIIGAGSAGLAALREVRRVTDDVVIIEAGPYGTTCARVGCMPSKLFIQASNAAHAVRGAATFGIYAAAPSIDGGAVMHRVRTMRDRFVSGIVEHIDGLPDGMVIRGEARFDGDDTLVVDTDGGRQTIRAKSVVIATGSRPTVPDEYAALAAAVTNDGIFDWSDLPQSVAVFGAGLVGLELGQALHRLGVRTRLFGKDGLVGPLSDPDLMALARDHFTEVLAFEPDFTLHEIVEDGEGATVHYASDGAERSETFDKLLVAIGRTANVDRLNLGSTSLDLDDDGVPTFDRATCRCGSSSIFLAGDAADELPVLHEASDGGAIAGANAALFPEVNGNPRKTTLTAMFCEPQIAMAGATHAELGDAEFVTGRIGFADQGRAKVMDEAVGALHLYAARPDGKILGMEMFGPAGEHLAHLVALAIHNKMTVADLIAAPFYHPTLEEGLKTAVCDALHQLGKGDAPLPYGLHSGPGG